MKLRNTAIIAAFLSVTVASSAVEAGDAAKGKRVYAKCKACHTIKKGGKNKLGPNLYGIIGRNAAGVEGFKYSNAMKNAGIAWTPDNLDKYLTKPKKFIPKNRMAFPGLRKKQQRDDVIAFMATFHE